MLPITACPGAPKGPEHKQVGAKESYQDTCMVAKASMCCVQSNQANVDRLARPCQSRKFTLCNSVADPR